MSHTCVANSSPEHAIIQNHTTAAVAAAAVMHHTGVNAVLSCGVGRSTRGTRKGQPWRCSLAQQCFRRCREQLREKGMGVGRSCGRLGMNMSPESISVGCDEWGKGQRTLRYRIPFPSSGALQHHELKHLHTNSNGSLYSITQKKHQGQQSN
jgi:hypothetical protein